MPEFQDWLRGLALLGQDGSDYIVVKVASTGELYTLIQGQYAGSPVTVAVDADGNILAVLKGEYAGSLVTVKLDSEGRLFTYVVDEIDQFGHILPGGLTELAARLGSVMAYERRGQVVLADILDTGLGAWTLQGSAGYSIVLDPAYQVYGGYSAHMTQGGAPDYYAQMIRLCGGFPADVGVGVAFWAIIGSNTERIEFGVTIADGADLHMGRVRWDASTKQLRYQNAAGSWVQFGSWTLTWPGPNYFRFFKVAIDTSTEKMLYAVVDGVQHDLSALSYYKGSTTHRYFTSDFYIQGTSVKTAEAYVDSCVFTARETNEYI